MARRQGDKSTAIKITVLSLAFVTISNAFLSPAMAAIAAAFPDVGMSSIQFVMNISMLGSFAASLFMGKLISLARAKTLLVLSAGFIAFGSLYPLALHGRIVYLYASSLIVGAGQGIAMAMSNTLITQHFEEPSRSWMFGVNNMVVRGGSVIMALVAGWLAAGRWSDVYWTGLLCLPSLALVAAFMPNDGRGRPRGRDPLVGARPSGWHIAAVPLAVIILFLAIPFAANLMNYAMLLEDRLHEGPATAGVVSSVCGVAAMLGGLFYKKINDLLKHNTLFVGGVLLSAGLLITIVAPDTFVFTVGQCLTNVGFSALGFVGGLHAISVLVPMEKLGSSNGLYVAFQTLGSLITPFVVNPVSKAVSGMASAIGNYRVSLAIAVATTVAAFIWGAVYRERLRSAV